MNYDFMFFETVFFSVLHLKDSSLWYKNWKTEKNSMTQKIYQTQKWRKFYKSPENNSEIVNSE